MFTNLLAWDAIMHMSGVSQWKEFFLEGSFELQFRNVDSQIAFEYIFETIAHFRK